MPTNNLHNNPCIVASSPIGENDKPSVSGVSSFSSLVVCYYCKKSFYKRNGHINEANRRGYKIFCSKGCSGKHRRTSHIPIVEDTRVCKICKCEYDISMFSRCHKWLYRYCNYCKNDKKRKNTNSCIPKDQIFIEIKGYNGAYAIGDKGVVISFCSDHKRRFYKKMKTHTDKKGYSFVLLRSNGKTKINKVHRLVAIHFIENTYNKAQVNHIDGDKSNNRVSNLEWATGHENRKHAFTIGLVSNKGIDHPSHKLSNEDVISIYNSKDDAKTLSLFYKVTKTTIRGIKSGRSWPHLTKQIKK